MRARQYAKAPHIDSIIDITPKGTSGTMYAGIARAQPGPSMITVNTHAQAILFLCPRAWHRDLLVVTSIQIGDS
jgi:hypothetical protein